MTKLLLSEDVHYDYINYREYEEGVKCADIVLNGNLTNYFICSDGRLFTKKFGNHSNAVERDITPKPSNDGYKSRRYRRACIYCNGKYAHGSIHRLVAEAFIPNPENKPCVNHIDGNKNNNDIHNLEWATFSENNQHAFDHKLRIAPKGEDVVWSVLTNKQANEIGRLLEENELTIGEIAAKLGTTYAIVKKIKQGKAWVDAVKPYDVTKHTKTEKGKVTFRDVLNVCDYLQYTDFCMATISMITGVKYCNVTDIFYRRRSKDISARYDFSYREMLRDKMKHKSNKK